jgi:hypothetical protein
VADVNLTRHLELAFDGLRIVFKGGVLLALLVALFLALLVDAARDALHVLAQAFKTWPMRSTLSVLRSRNM